MAFMTLVLVCVVKKSTEAPQKKPLKRGHSKEAPPFAVMQNKQCYWKRAEVLLLIFV
jgi:hypothetical protein